MKNNLGEKDKNNKFKGERIAFPIRPGAILLDRLLKPLKTGIIELAKELKVSEKEMRLVCEEKIDIIQDLVRRLSIYFDTSVELGLNLQKSYEEDTTELKFELLKKEIKPYRKVKKPAPIGAMEHQRFKRV